jgi:hypothetical protein
MLVTALNSIFLVIYLLSAAVQYNDPDALAWIAIYLLAASMCALQYRKRRQHLLPRILLAICLVWMGSLLPDVVGRATLPDIFASISMQTRAVEEAREIGGLFLIVLWAGVLSFRRVGS